MTRKTDEKRGRGHPPAMTADGEILTERVMIRAADKKIMIRATREDEVRWRRAAQVEGFWYGAEGAVSPLGRKVLNAHVRKSEIHVRANDPESVTWQRAASAAGTDVSTLARKLLNAHAKRLGL